MPLGPGDRMPSFSLTDQDGRVVDSDQLLGKGPVVVFFYPKDNTAGCTREACAFRDQYEVFTDAGATVVGISSDSERSHRDFADRHRLPFTLLSDPGQKVRRAFKVRATLGLIAGRVTFVVDRDGVIRNTFESQVRPVQHVHEALETVRSLGGPVSYQD